MKLEIDNVRLRRTQQEWVLELVFPQEASDLAAYYISRIGKYVDVVVDERVAVDIPEGELEDEVVSGDPTVAIGIQGMVNNHPVMIGVDSSPSKTSMTQNVYIGEDPRLKYISRLHGVLGANKVAFKEKYGIESFSDLPEDILKICIDRIEFKDTPDDVRHVSEEQLKTYISEFYNKLI